MLSLHAVNIINIMGLHNKTRVAITWVLPLQLQHQQLHKRRENGGEGGGMVRWHCHLLVKLFGPPKFGKVWQIWQAWKVQCRFGIKVYKGVQFGPPFYSFYCILPNLKARRFGTNSNLLPMTTFFCFFYFKAKIDFFSIVLNLKFLKLHIQHQSKLAKCPFWKKCYWLLINYLQINNSKLSMLFIDE